MSKSERPIKMLWNFLKNVAKFLLVTFVVIAVVTDLAATVDFDATTDFSGKILSFFGVSDEYLYSEDDASDYSDTADILFNTRFFIIFSIVAFIISVVGTLILTRKRSIFAALGLFFTFILPREKVTWGSVIDSKTKEPVPFAILRVINPNDKNKVIIAETVADVDGKYRLNLSEKALHYKLQVAAKGYGSLEENVDYVPSGPGKYDIVQDVVLGRVSNDTFIDRVNYFRPILYKYLVGIVYIFSIVYFVFFIYYLIAYPGSFYGVMRFGIFLFTVIWNTLVIRERFGIKAGYILDSYTKKPIAGAFVSLFDSKKKMMTGVEISNKNGLVRFEVPAGDYSARVDKAGYGLLLKQEASGQTVKVSISKDGYVVNNIYLTPTKGQNSPENSLELLNPFAETNTK